MERTAKTKNFRTKARMIDMIICPSCQTTSTQVIESRDHKRGGSGIRRRRKCKVCGETFATLELVISRGPITRGGVKSALEDYTTVDR